MVNDLSEDVLGDRISEELGIKYLSEATGRTWKSLWVPTYSVGTRGPLSHLWLVMANNPAGFFSSSIVGPLGPSFQKQWVHERYMFWCVLTSPGWWEIGPRVGCRLSCSGKDLGGIYALLTDIQVLPLHKKYNFLTMRAQAPLLTNYLRGIYHFSPWSICNSTRLPHN